MTNLIHATSASPANVALNRKTKSIGTQIAKSLKHNPSWEYRKKVKGMEYTLGKLRVIIKDTDLGFETDELGFALLIFTLGVANLLWYSFSTEISAGKIIDKGIPGIHKPIKLSVLDRWKIRLAIKYRHKAFEKNEFQSFKKKSKVS